MYWTANTVMGPSQLCERCALLALNFAAFGFVRRPFASVQEGLDYINGLCVKHDLEPLELTHTEFGVCDHCGEDFLRPAAAAEAS